MQEWLTEPSATAVVAFVTTLHCALALLRNHRSSKSAPLAVVPSFAFAVFPWILSSPLWLLIGMAAHLAWFAGCERFLPAPVAATPPQRAAPIKRPPKGFRPLQVLATFPETEEIRTFRLQRPEDFSFKPGQFVMVRVQIEGMPVVRCYSITSAPSTTGYLEISVRAQGLVSRHLHLALKPGMTVEVNGPGGAFVYPSGKRPMVLLAGGIGITPLLAMLRHALECEPSRSVTLLLSAKTAAHVPFANELSLFAKRHPQFRLAVTLSAGPRDPRFASGRIDRQLIERVVPHATDAVYMICGPLAMIDEMRRILDALGVPPAQVHFEKFEAAVSHAAASATGAHATVTMQPGGRTLRVAEGQTVLEAADAASVSLPSMCRVGVCGTCRVRLLSGDVEGDFDAIDASEQAEGFVLACVARPVTDCVIEA